MFIYSTVCNFVLTDAALRTHLDDAHIDMDRLKFALFRIYNHVQMCRKQNYHCSRHVDSDWTVYNIGNVKSSAGLFSPTDDYISAE